MLVRFIAKAEYLYALIEVMDTFVKSNRIANAGKIGVSRLEEFMQLLRIVGGIALTVRCQTENAHRLLDFI